MTPTKFSIVIPTFNRADLIFDTLETVFDQNYQNFEVIVVDNCSTDDTVDLLQPLVDSGQIRLIQNERNFERAHSRNIGMRHATGDFLTFLDSDDFLYPDCLADATQFVSENPELKCFHCLYELVDGNRLPVRQYAFPNLDDPIKAIVSGNFMSCIGNFVHRDIYSTFEFDTFPDLTGAEDWEFWLRVIGDFGIGRISKANAGILQHTGRTVQSKHHQNLEKGYQHLFAKFESDAHLRSIYLNHLGRIKANSYMYLSTLANTSGDFNDARNFLRMAVGFDASVLFGSRFLRTSLRTLLRRKIRN